MKKFCRIVQFFCKTMPGLPPKVYFLGRLPEGASLLDVGCGDGAKLCQCLRLRPDLCPQGCDIIDFSNKLSSSIPFCVVNIQNSPWPWPDNSFDGVMMNHVLEHLDDSEPMLKELRRVLKESGEVYMALPAQKTLTFPSFKTWLGHEGGPINFFDDPTHVRAYSGIEIKALLQRTGFSVIHMGAVRNLPGIILSPFYIILGFLMRNRRWAVRGIHQLTGWSFYVVAKKK